MPSRSYCSRVVQPGFRHSLGTGICVQLFPNRQTSHRDLLPILNILRFTLPSPGQASPVNSEVSSCVRMLTRAGQPTGTAGRRHPVSAFYSHQVLTPDVPGGHRVLQGWQTSP